MQRQTLKFIIALVVWVGVCFGTNVAKADGKILNITLQGAFDKQTTEDYVLTRKTYGLELGIPITWFFEVELGHTVTQQTRNYTDAYRTRYNAYLKSRGGSPMEGDLYDSAQQVDSTLNGSLGYPIGYFYPYIFGGALSRKAQGENFFEVSDVTKEETWNAGVGLSTYITANVKFKLSHRVSPSVPKSLKLYDSLTSVGLTWGI